MKERPDIPWRASLPASRHPEEARQEPRPPGILPRLPPRRFLEGIEGRAVIRLGGDLGHELDIPDRVRRIDDENGPGEQRYRQVLDQDAVVLAEALVALVGEVVEVVDIG